MTPGQELDQAMTEALLEYKDAFYEPSQDEFIEKVISKVIGEVPEDDANKIAEFYQMHFE